MQKISDKDIIESIKRGNKNDFSILIDRYKNRAFSLLKNMLKNEMDAEEALQDSFLKAYNSLVNFRGDSKFSTWFYKIVFNTGVSILKLKGRQIEKQMLNIDDLLFLKDKNKFESDRIELKEFVYSLINKIPIKYSLILILYYIDNFTLNEISEILNISISNAKTSLHRARTELRNVIVKYNYKEELI